MKLKVCGMRYEDNIQLIAAINPDYMGFIFFEGSSRHVSARTPALPSSLKKVGVFVNASYETIIEKIKTHNLQAVQLHGEESPEFCKSLQKSSNNYIFNSLGSQKKENKCKALLSMIWVDLR